MMATLMLDAPQSRSLAGDALIAAMRAPDLSSSRWDYAASPDDELVVFARKINDRRAIHTLIERHYPWLRRLIGWRARQEGLGREDTEDAQQDVVFSLFEAIVDYDLCGPARPGGCLFRSFLRRRALSRFHDTLRRVRWLHARQHGDVQLLVALEGQSKPIVLDARKRGWRQLELADPALAAQWRELYELVREGIARLAAEEQRILEQSAEGVSIEQLAHEAGVSPSTLSRRRDQLYAAMRANLKDWQP
jgi:RNA polymerase sigma factor (sigma-70 family)